jgi:hypothetical protein
MVLSKGIESVFTATKENEVVWFLIGGSKYIQRTALKNVIKLYSLIEQKTEKQDEYRFKCADNTYKYVITEAFFTKR